MSIVNVKKSVNGREAAEAAGGRSITDIYTVLSDSLDENPWNVLNATGLPRRFDIHSGSPQFYLDEKRITEQQGALFTVACVFKVASYIFDNSGGVDDPPWMQPVSISRTSFVETHPMESAFASTFNSPNNTTSTNRDVAVVNSAGMSFEQQPHTEVHVGVYTFIKNDLLANFDLIDEYEGAVNSDRFFDKSAGLCKMDKIDLVRERWGNYFYYRKTYIVHVRKALPEVTQSAGGGSQIPMGGAIRTWWKRKLDEGLYGRLSSNPENPTEGLFPILDQDGKPIAQPEKLDGGGQPSITPVFLEFRDFLHLPFAALNIFGAGMGFGVSR